MGTSPESRSDPTFLHNNVKEYSLTAKADVEHDGPKRELKVRDICSNFDPLRGMKAK